MEVSDQEGCFSDALFRDKVVFFDSDEEMQVDDLVALSGQPGKSFHKIQTGTATTQQLQQLRNLEKAVIANASSASSQCGICDSELEQMIDLTLEELLLAEDVSSMCSSTRVDIELEWDNDTPIQPSLDNSTRFLESSQQNNNSEEFDFDLVNPYRQVISHGGYYGDGLNAIVVFSACYLPDRSASNYQLIMDNLFLYIIHTLDMIVADKYLIIFLNGGSSRKNVPSFSWLRKCYQMINKRLHKNLQYLLIVHASWYIKLLVTFFRPFVSSKFGRKLKLVPTLYNLADIVAVDGVAFPEVVLQHDLLIQAKRKKMPVPKDCKITQ